MDYRGLIVALPFARHRLALIDPSKAINLHGTRSSNQRQGGADLIGSAAPDPSVEKIAFAQLQDNGAPDFNWSSTLRIDGDITSRYPLAASNYDVKFGPMDLASPTSITFTGTSFNRGAACGGTHSGGYTSFIFGFLLGSAPGATITVTTFVGGSSTVIDYWPDVPQCSFSSGPPPLYRYYDLST